MIRLLTTLVVTLAVSPVLAQPLERTRWSGRSNGDPVFRIVDDVSLARFGLAGFSLTFTGSDKQLDMISTGAFDMYDNRITPVLEVLLSRDSGRQAFDWDVTRQALPHRPYFGPRTFEESGTVPKGAGTRLIPLYLAPGSGDPVLQGFSLQTVGEARKVEEMGVELIKNPWGYPTYHLRVTLRQAKSFAFQYRVQYTTVMDAYVLRRGTETLTGRASASRFVGNRNLRNPALQGFRLRFDNGRHEIDRIGVIIDTEYATAWFADGSANDPFTATLRWIDFPNF